MNQTRTIVADMHAHSTASDGEYTPAALVQAAYDRGLHAVALTDHDTIAGLDEAVQAGHALGVQVIPGIEVSLRFRLPFFVGSLHLLLYFSEQLLQHPDFRATVVATTGKGRGPTLVQDRVEAINAAFGPQSQHPLLQRPLQADEVSAYADNVTRRHFALALSEQHGLPREQVNAILANDSPAYIPSGIDMAHLKPLIDQFPVVRVFAHPAAGSYPGESIYREVLPPIEVVEQLLPTFLDPATLGLDGLEVYYPGHVAEHRDLLCQWAAQHGLFVTGGSDCHDEAQRPLGIEGMTQPELDALLARVHSGSVTG